MKVVNYQKPQSSFLAMEKDMGQLVDLIMRNNRLKKLLYYSKPECLTMPDLTQEQTFEVFKNNIKLVPKLYIDSNVLNYIVINFDVFTPSENPEFRDNMIEFDIICHFDQWQLKDFSLRPYKIAGEIDSMLNHTKLSGIGELEFVGANQMVLTDEFAGLCLMYQSYHSVEDKEKSPNPGEQADIDLNFDKIFNIK